MFAKTLWAFALGLLLSRSSAQTASTPDENARFLAGLPVRGTALEAYSRASSWAEHAIAFDQAWQKLETRQLHPIQTWTQEFLPEPSKDPSPLLYMFSGPDFLYAHAFFPNASTYVLCGIEPVGDLPELEKLPPASLEPSLQLLRRSLESVLSWSFFITKDMRVELELNRLKGTLPILYVFLARSGCHIDEARLVALDRSGALADGKGHTQGVKITFTAAGALQPQTLYYFNTDISDGQADRSGFLNWCATLGDANSFLKASSYLMHEGGFETVRKFLLTHSKLILQDDAGIPIRFYDPASWNIRLFGAYPGPIEIFKQHYQPQLKDLYSRSHPPKLSFGFGYRWQSVESSLIVAQKKG